MADTKKFEQMISVIMPTFRRPDGLKIALESLLAQSPCDLPVEIIVADNDPKGSARDYVKAVAEKNSASVHYLHVPAPGVSNARNAALTVAKGRYIAWLDDDQEAHLCVDTKRRSPRRYSPSSRHAGIHQNPQLCLWPSAQRDSPRSRKLAGRCFLDGCWRRSNTGLLPDCAFDKADRPSELYSLSEPHVAGLGQDILV